MKNRRAVLATVLCLLVATAQDGANAPKPAGPLIGTIDLVKAIDQYPKAIKELKRLSELRTKMVEQIAERKRRLEELRLQFQSLQEGSPQRRMLENDYKVEAARLDGYGSILKAEFDGEREKFEVEAYADMERAIEIVAKGRGVSLVLRVHPERTPAEDSGDQTRERLMNYDRRQVWFASEEIDLTPAVIRLLQVPLEPVKDEGAKGGAVPSPGSGSANK